MKKWIKSHNLPMMLLSLVLAIVLWMYIVGVENPEKDTEIRGITIQFTGLELLDDRDLTIVNGMDQTVDIRVRGRRGDLMNLDKESNVSVTVDVSAINAAGTFSPKVEVSVPPAVELVRQSLNRLSLEVEQLLSRQIDIDVKLDPASTIADGHMTGDLTADPEFIRVRGPKSIVSKIETAAVLVKRENISSTIVADMDYVLLDQEGNEIAKDGLEIGQDQVSVTVSVLVVKTVPLKLDFKEGGGATLSNVKCQIDPSSITLSGDSDILEGLNQISLGVIDLSQVYHSTKENMDIILPNGVTSISGEETATVNIELTGLKSKQLTVTEIAVDNKPENLNVELLTQQITVTVRGTAEAVDQITAANVRVVVDLEGLDLPVGQQTVVAHVMLDGYTDAGILGTDYKVNLNISRGTG